MSNAGPTAAPAAGSTAAAAATSAATTNANRSDPTSLKEKPSFHPEALRGFAKRTWSKEPSTDGDTTETTIRSDALLVAAEYLRTMAQEAILRSVREMDAEYASGSGQAPKRLEPKHLSKVLPLLQTDMM